MKKFFIKLFLIFLAPFFVLGCHSLKAPESPSQIWQVPAWEKTSRSKDLVWQSAKEKTVETGEPLALSELVDIALQNNPKTHEAWENAKAAQTLITQAKSKLYPQLTTQAKGGKQQISSHPHLNDLNEADIGMSMTASWLLLDFGGRHASIKEAVQNLLAANFQFNQSIQDLLLTVVTAYYQHYSALAMVEAAASDVRDAKTSLDAAEQKLRVGLSAKLDVLQSRSNYENSLYDLEDAKGQVKTAKANLAEALGVPADEPFKVSPPSKKIPTYLAEQNIDKIIEDALKARPDVAAGRASLRAKESAVKAAFSDLLPTFNASGSGETIWYKYYSSPRHNEHDLNYTGYLSMDWDIFNGFDNIAKHRQAKAEAKAERMNLLDTEISASADVWKKYYDFKTAVRKLEFAESFAATSQESYALALESYNAGLKSIIDLLDSQSSLSQARSQLIQAKEDTFIAFANLAHSTGKIYAQRELIASTTQGE